MFWNFRRRIMITIKIQSFIDIITNSSTEIYIQAGDFTIKGIKEIINTFLRFSNCKDYNADDLFEFEIVSDCGQSYCELIPKIQDQEIKNLAILLSNLHNLFDIDAIYDS